MEVNLPMEITATEILPKLPVKSLLRFKCVSKFFQTLISSPEFVNLHLHRSQSSNTKRLLIFTTGDNNDSLSSTDLDSPEFPADNLPIPLPDNNGNPNVHLVGSCLVGSCNGLLCVQLRHKPCHSYFVLLNPSTRFCRQITCRYSDTTNLACSLNYGFGVGNEGNDDFKIVHICTYRRYDGNIIHDPNMEVRVYRLKENSWRVVDKSSPCIDFLSALIDNHLLHWKFWHPSEAKHRIGCFDVCTEKWGNDVALPDDYDTNWAATHHLVGHVDLVQLGVLDGCLCVLMRYQHDPVVDVWVMKEYGVKESWFKLLGFSDLGVARSLNLKVPLFAYA